MRRWCDGTLTRAAESNSTASSRTIRPRSGVSRPAIMLTSVVLPAPDGPNSAVTPPAAWKRATKEKSPSFFSTSTDSTSISEETRAGAARQPFGDDEGSQRNDNRDDDKASGGGFAARHLHEGID